ncbi:hypothetical protein HYZ98_02585 [Candidatus Peregrinibacteria bacterium]|nr:hypothetical protein [Candidatus Peregrinibacteria bacterium]
MPILLIIVAILFASIVQIPTTFAASQKRELRTCYEITDKKVAQECIQSIRGRLRSGTLQNLRPYGGEAGIKKTPVPKKPDALPPATLRQCQKFEVKKDRERCQRETLEGVRDTARSQRKYTRTISRPTILKPGRQSCDQSQGQERTNCLQDSRKLRSADTATIRRGGRRFEKKLPSRSLTPFE